MSHALCTPANVPLIEVLISVPNVATLLFIATVLVCVVVCSPSHAVPQFSPNIAKPVVAIVPICTNISLNGVVINPIELLMPMPKPASISLPTGIIVVAGDATPNTLFMAVITLLPISPIELINPPVLLLMPVANPAGISAPVAATLVGIVSTAAVTCVAIVLAAVATVPSLMALAICVLALSTAVVACASAVVSSVGVTGISILLSPIPLPPVVGVNPRTISSMRPRNALPLSGIFGSINIACCNRIGSLVRPSALARMRLMPSSNVCFTVSAPCTSPVSFSTAFASISICESLNRTSFKMLSKFSPPVLISRSDFTYSCNPIAPLV